MKEHPSEAQELDRAFEIGIVSARVLAVVTTILNASRVEGRIKNRAAIRLGLVGILAYSIACIRDLRHRGAALSPRRARTDVVSVVSMIAAEAIAWQGRVVTSDPTISPSYASIVNAWLPLQLDDQELALSVAAVLSSYLAVTSSRSSLDPDLRMQGQRIAGAVGIVQGSSVAHSFVRIVREQIQAFETSRAAASRAAARAQAELERQHQFRILHDSALQILEAIGGKWDIDADMLERRTDYEIARLVRLLDGRTDTDQTLEQSISELADVYASAGLEIRFTIEPGLVADGAVVEALRDATGEALQNVLKHAAATTVDIAVEWADPGIEVIVSDQGRGFDTDLSTSGFGLAHSIRGRMADVNGRATVESHPGAGTRVVLWGPA